MSVQPELKVMKLYEFLAVFSWTLLHYVRLMAWAVRLSSVCNVVARYPQGWSFWHRVVAWGLRQFVLKFGLH